MDAYIQTLIGVGVSVVLFFVTYRQTIGARRQRVILANTEVHRAVLRRLVLEAYQPTLADMERLSRGKARLHRVPPDLMDSAEESLIDVYASIFDNDLIPAAERANLQKRVVEALEQTAGPAKETLTRDSRRNRAPRAYLATVVAATSVVGAVATLLASVVQTGFISSEAVQLTGAVFIASVALTSAVIALRRVRERSESAQPSAVEPVLQVFRDARSAIQENRLSYETFVGQGGNENFDFLIAFGDRRIAIETFSELGDTRARVAAPRLLPLLKDLADELWIVTPEEVSDEGRKPFANQPVRFVRSSQLEQQLREIRSAAPEQT